ncbi:hypothetical protein L6452_27965 [Arctium lappa]|uniref:Uncharacterized protein n=1 Tax=Arctium lappa TaxID=4217 RepID=A0ACB8ZY53_ARCLA|nr:hypothetical protein L6452_27965 [Arctium lappa]
MAADDPYSAWQRLSYLESDVHSLMVWREGQMSSPSHSSYGGASLFTTLTTTSIPPRPPPVEELGRGPRTRIPSHVMVRLLLSSRAPSMTCTFVLGDWWTYVVGEYELDYVTTMVSGEMMDEGFPPFAIVTRVFIPICILERHWLIGDLEMDTMTLTVVCIRQLLVRDLRGGIEAYDCCFGRSSPCLFYGT